MADPQFLDYKGYQIIHQYRVDTDCTTSRVGGVEGSVQTRETEADAIDAAKKYIDQMIEQKMASH